MTTLASNRFAPTCFLTCGDLMKQQYASSNECTQCPTTMSFPLNHGSSTPAASMTLLCSWPRDASLLTCMVTPGKMSLPPKPRRVTVTSPSSSLSPSLPCCATSLASSLSARGRLHRLHPSIDRLKGGLVLESNWQRMMSMREREREGGMGSCASEPRSGGGKGREGEEGKASQRGRGTTQHVLKYLRSCWMGAASAGPT